MDGVEGVGRGGRRGDVLGAEVDAGELTGGTHGGIEVEGDVGLAGGVRVGRAGLDGLVEAGGVGVTGGSGAGVLGISGRVVLRGFGADGSIGSAIFIHSLMTPKGEISVFVHIIKVVVAKQGRPFQTGGAPLFSY